MGWKARMGRRVRSRGRQAPVKRACKELSPVKGVRDFGNYGRP